MKAVVALSGGMDSATVLAKAKAGYKQVEAVGFTYGSKHNKYENQAAERIADHYNADYRLIDLSHVMEGIHSDLMISGGDIPEGHYEAESMKRTVVPGRNLIFTSILAAICESEGGGVVLIGVHSGDHAIYPDCRPPFVKAVQQTVITSSDGKVTVLAPFLFDTKRSILEWGLPAGVPYHLTRTCYKDQPLACGRCGSCQERLSAFAELGKVDPLEYESRAIFPLGDPSDVGAAP